MGHVIATDGPQPVKCPRCGQALREVVRDQGGAPSGGKLRD